jgi:hypothetical protein
LYNSFFKNWLIRDLVILMEDKEPHRVHQDVVCRQSEYFARLRNQKWKADNVSYHNFNPTEPRVVLKCDPRVLTAMVDFMYGYSYDNSSSIGTPRILFAARVYLAAKEYGMPRFKDAVTLTLAMFANVDWDIPEFSSIITEVYAITTKADKALRGPLLKTCYEYSSYFEEKEDFRQVQAECEEFRTDLDSFSVDRASTQGHAFVALLCYPHARMSFSRMARRTYF